MSQNEPDWERIRAIAASRASGPREWPKGVRPMSLEGLALLGVDEKHRQLFWDGKPLEFKKRLVFTRSQQLGAVLIALGAFFAGLGALLGAWPSAHRFACEVGLMTTWCPTL